jgi:hypothetical protein
VGSGRECVRQLTGSWVPPHSIGRVEEERASFLAAAEGRAPDGHGGGAALRAVMDELLTRRVAEDDPPEVWRTARQLLDAGIDPLDVHRQLAAVNWACCTPPQHCRGHPVDLGDLAGGLDRRALALVLAAIAHAAGSHEHRLITRDATGIPYPGDRMPPLVAWPVRE